MRKLYILFVLICMSGLIRASESDTIPPVIINPADSLLIPCGKPLASSFEEWYKNNGGLLVEDEGEFEYFRIPENVILEELLETAEDTLCGGTYQFEFGFFAIDDCNNSSDTSYVIFGIVDVLRPEIIIQPDDLLLTCEEGVQDSIQNWLDNRGNAVLEEECSDSLNWTTYFWADNEGNNGTGNLNEPHNIEINRTRCDWSAAVTMSVRDECGNLSIIEANIILTDETGPELASELRDTTIACTESLDGLIPVFIDACDDTTDVAILTEESTQGDDPGECSFYNFTIEREYISIDECDNVSTATQTIEVIDTMAPFVRAFDTLEITCDVSVINLDDFFLQIEDCSEINYEISDSTVFTGNCNQEFIRSWTFFDICGNESQFEQFVRRVDTIRPTIEETPDDLLIDCIDLDNTNELLKNYVQELLDIDVRDNCSNTVSKVFDSSIDPQCVVDVTFLPFYTCAEGDTVLFRKELIYQILDDCENDTTYFTNILLTNNELPEYEDCNTGSEEITLIEGTCDTTIWIDVPNIIESCNTTENSMLFYKRVLIDPSQDLANAFDTDWSFEIPENIEISDNASMTITLHNVTASEEPISISIKDQQIEFSVNEEINSEGCEENSVSVEIENSILMQWVELGSIQLSGNISGGSNEECDDEPELDIEITVDFRQELESVTSLFVDDSLIGEVSDSVQVNLEAGNHTIEFSTRDCAGNEISCSQSFSILDIQLPQISCPNDTLLFVGQEECNIIFTLSNEINLIENCRNSFSNLDTLPMGDGFIQFFENEEGNLLPNNIQVSFEDINTETQIINPVLIVRYKMDTGNENGNFSIRNEEGDEIGTTSQVENSCTDIIEIEFDLDEESFASWQEDGEVNFTFLHPNGQETGVLPCSPENLENQIDGESFLKAVLAFTEVNPTIEVRDDEGRLVDINESNEVDLTLGTYIVSLLVEDISGNEASCEYELVVEDDSPPIIECETFEVVLPVIFNESIFNDPQFYITNVSDNCSEVDFAIEIGDLDCSTSESTTDVTITATDESENESSCETSLQVTLAELEPSFSSSLCGGDTLLLFNNIDLNGTNEILEFQWSGPLNFSSNAAEPIITNVVVENSGEYNLEVTNSFGCVYSGTLEIFIETLDSPEISGSSEFVCEGDGVILNSNSFSDDVTYAWFEGISPNGILLGETPGPSFEISPTLGEHNYYVIAIGPNCESNPSNTFTLEVIQTPVAEVEEVFISVCEGETITLQGSNFNPSYEYIWTGPNGYEGSGLDPEAIPNASLENGGDYELVVTDRGCVSEPAVVTVAIFQRPITPIISGDNIVCSGSTFVLTVINITSASRYRWFLDGTDQGATSDNTLTIANATDNLSGAWTVIVEDQQSCTSDESESFVVQVEDEINIGATNSGPICEGEEVTLTATFTPNAVYVWTAPNNQIYEGQIVTVPGIPGVYNLVVTTLTGCDAEITTTLEVQTLPEITSLTNTSMSCMVLGDSFTFSATVFPTGDYEFLWTGPNNFSSTEEAPVVIYEGPQNNGIYTLQVGSGDCMTEPATTEVNILPIPETPEISGTGTVCPGDNVVLFVFPDDVPDATYIWDTPLGQITTDDAFINIPSVNSSDQGDYTVIIESQNCESEASEIFSLTVFDEVTSPFIIGEENVCEGDTITLNVTPEIAEGDYIWTLPDGSTFTGNEFTIEGAQLSDSGSYTVLADLNGCQSNTSLEFTLEVQNAPTVPVLANDVFIFCSDNESVNFDLGDAPENGTLDLYSADGTFIASSGDGFFEDVAISNFDTNPISLEVGQTIDGCESLATTTIEITLEEAPSGFATFQDTSFILCELGEFTIPLNTPDDVNSIEVESDGNSVLISSFDLNSVVVEVIDVGEATISVISNSDLCGSYARDETNISFTNPMIILEDDEFSFAGLEPPVSLDIIENDELTDAYTLEIIESSAEFDVEVSGDQIIINGVSQIQESYEIVYEICDSLCVEICAQGTIAIGVGSTEEDCVANNLITPNGDGANDFLEAPCSVPGSPGVVELQIFNASGDRVYIDKDYQNDWDGTYNGNVLPVGTYYYSLKLNDGITSFGFIVLEL